jgi:hypothetical protein
MRLFFVSISFLLVINTSISQTWGDTLYVGLKSGIDLFRSPNESAQVYYHLGFNEKMVERDLAQLDTIDLRIANWIYVETVDNKAGWIFSGYTNHHPLPTKQFSSFRIFIRDWVSSLPESYHTEYYDKGETEMEFLRIVTSGSKVFHQVDIGGWEYGHTEIELYDWDLHEILNIIALSLWDTGPRNQVNYENVEFAMLRDSAKNGEYDKFQWLNGFDDPAEFMVLEARHPKGIRITMWTE